MEDILNERQKTVLKEVCESFILTGIPIGSRVLSKSSKLSCSPATLRNEMADLEEMGFLCSPHTSAGRVPTEKGYRFYVNFLVEFEKIGQKEDNLIKKIADISKENSLKQQDILKSAVKYACEKTHLAGVLLVPQQEHSELRSVKLFRILSDKAMLVTVDDSGNISNEIVTVPTETSDDVLEKLSVLLNAQLCNKQYHQYEQEYIEKTRMLISRYNNLLSQLVKKVQRAGSESAEDSIFMEGFLNFFDQPEFNDPNKMKQMVALLNQKDNLLNLLAKSLESKSEIVVNIGSDTGLAIKDMSLVTARYQGPNSTFGKIGLIGPLRMNYVNVVATLARLSYTLSQLLLGNNTFSDE
ncbi:MAG: heat-inducible transcriptional repressor HrcA [Candidatus Riflebacteria bacterium]|nr:heat-inducible transcriptional repressor HrcA [Candidatus Riflebacteria bacterium]